MCIGNKVRAMRIIPEWFQNQALLIEDVLAQLLPFKSQVTEVTGP
jgi:hypothetical protein